MPGMPGMLGMLGIGMLLRVGLGKRVNWCVNNAGIWLCWQDRLSVALVLSDVTRTCMMSI